MKSMYAVIRDGGKQYKVLEGQTVDLERKDVAPGEVIELTDVLLISNNNGEVQVGSPVLEGACVTATVLGELRGRKIRVVKYKRRKGYRRHTGHRQNYIRVRIDKITAPGQTPGSSTTTEETEEATQAAE